MHAIFLLLATAVLLSALETRVWTDTQDRKVEAEMVAVDDTSITLRLKDGREVPFPTERLSEADVKYVEENRGKLGMAEPGGRQSADGEEQALNFEDPWPDRVTFTEDPEIATIEEDAEKKRFIYESANYRYVCDVRLAKSVVKGFAVMFEATHLVTRTMPLGITEGQKTDGKYLILLFENFEAYVQAGGPPDSAGVFLGGRGIVMVPLTSLGVRPVGSGYMLDRDKSSKTLPHELVHQITPEPYYESGALGWFSEGIAEYVATTPYRSGSYNVRSNFRPIVEYATAYGEKNMGGRALGTEISLPALKTFMLQDYQTFLSRASVNYGSALLITTYFLHLDGEGDARRMKGFLRGLHEGKKGEEALEALLDGRTFEELEADIIREWGRKGVDFTFAS